MLGFKSREERYEESVIAAYCEEGLLQPGKDTQVTEEQIKYIEHKNNDPSKCFCGICGWVDCSEITRCH